MRCNFRSTPLSVGYNRQNENCRYERFQSGSRGNCVNIPKLTQDYKRTIASLYITRLCR